MSSEPSFIAPFAKVERAKTQINELNIATKAFFEASRNEIVSEVNMDTMEEIWRFQLQPKVPHDFSVRVGEILHNLRSSLDQMLAEIVTRVSSRSEGGVEFPFGKSIGEFETALRKQKKLPAAAADIIRGLQPYRGGNELLCLLHVSNRLDKHRTGLVPVNLRTAGKVSYLSVWNGQVLVIGSRAGQHLAVENKFTSADYLRFAVQNKAWGTYGVSRLDPVSGLPMSPDAGDRLMFDNLGPGSPEESMEFLVTTPGTKIKTDFEPSLDIAFRDIRGFERKPIVHVLTDARDLVERILLTFRSRFFP